MDIKAGALPLPLFVLGTAPSVSNGDFVLRGGTGGGILEFDECDK